MNVGIDIGSTTIKLVAVNDQKEMVYKRYERHFSKIDQKLRELLIDFQKNTDEEIVKVTMTGSAGMDLADVMDITFIQEVIAATYAVQRLDSNIKSVIEIGGEDVKVIFLGETIEQRMNSACAGGTGAFIDQMAKLLNMTPTELNACAKESDHLYPIASRCGVFAKTDIQSLINQGISKENIAISIFQAVVNQTIAGLAQGKQFDKKVCFLGGPLTFQSELRKRFIETLKLGEEDYILPEDSQYYIAYGCSLYAYDQEGKSISDLIDSIGNRKSKSTDYRLEPLFKNQIELSDFHDRHGKEDIKHVELSSYSGKISIGIDAGSTTTKMVVIGENNELLHHYYGYNKGNVVDVVKSEMINIMSSLHDNVSVESVGVTGYGEALIKKALHADYGEVETMAHLEAAKFFEPNVDYIIDIGGQDMKCMSLKGDAIESMILNEACSSGCGSFISTFATSLGYEVHDFAKIALNAQRPADLGSRCTIFMNSSVKQAQKEGATVEDISAGLGMSVIKNALYKVMRVNHGSELGENIVVQGGTFHNDAILRAFEKETQANVVRPSIAGLMGAFGIALLARKHQTLAFSSVKTLEDIQGLTMQSKTAYCKICPNQCLLTITTFSDKERYITGNRCERGLGFKEKKESFNAYAFKLDYFKKEDIGGPIVNASGLEIGMPMVLNMYENLPFWKGFFHQLGVKVHISDYTTKAMYEKGQYSIPSDTACYPAKVVHGHIESLIDQGVSKIFYPSIVYNFREKEYPKNHYNCPIVASYPEVIANNVDRLEGATFVNPYITLNDPKPFAKVMVPELAKLGINVSKKAIMAAYSFGMEQYSVYKNALDAYTKEAMVFAKDKGKSMIVLAGRPYHVDPEINHGIMDLLTSLDVVVLTEDGLSPHGDHNVAKVLNQWSYHTRLYDAAKWVVDQKDESLQLVQLVSFGCGLDAITTDEVKRILEEDGKVYTQLKIDEMSNLGAVKIRLRSLLATMKVRGDQRG